MNAKLRRYFQPLIGAAVCFLGGMKAAIQLDGLLPTNPAYHYTWSKFWVAIAMSVVGTWMCIRVASDIESKSQS